MVILMGLVGIVSWLFGMYVFSIAGSAVHEIEALIALLMGTVALGLAGVIEATQSLKNSILATRRAEPGGDAAAVSPPPPKPKLDWLGRATK